MHLSGRRASTTVDDHETPEIRRATSAAYVKYVQDTGIVEYHRTPGNLGAVVALRDIDESRSEIVTLSWWTSTDAIQAFAGDPPDRAIFSR
jgi:heme-degrading monooxygenase HmoA